MYPIESTFSVDSIGYILSRLNSASYCKITNLFDTIGYLVFKFFLVYNDIIGNKS